MSLDIREFRYYQFLAEKELVPPILCLNDPEHGPLFSNIFGDEDELVLFCLNCDAKVHPGLHLEEKIKSAIADNIDYGK